MRWILRGVMLFMVLALVAGGVSLYAYRTPLPYAGPKTVVIPPGAGARALLTTLHTEGLTPSPELMMVPLLVTANYKQLKAGEYEFAAGLSPAEIIAKIVRGEVVVHKITIPEGWTVWQVRDTLMKETLLSGELPAVIAEGSVAPDTMHYQRGEARAEVLVRMQDAQAKRLAELWQKRAADLPYDSPQQALIMASIVERETGEVDERALVAGVFVNRLRKGMLLQTDPSVIYGIEVERGGKPLERLLTTADLKRDTPYNTYTRAGLTPTPICNPGRKAIEAALNPAATDALYFVASGTGGHRFAATLKEHQQNVAAYRSQLRKGSAISAETPRP